MNQSPPKAERRHTSIYLQTQPEPQNSSIFKIDFGKENIPTQKISWDQYSKSLQQATVSQKKKPTQKYVELESQTDVNIKFKFPLYTDRQIGIKPEYQNLLQEAYDNDDDINTRESVMNFFIDVCKRDLVQGILENQQIKDQQGLKSHPKFFRLYIKIKLTKQIYQLVNRMIFNPFLSICLFSIQFKYYFLLFLLFNIFQSRLKIEKEKFYFNNYPQNY
ncbi:unnamed protein product (macronuclear) [Paramecium tetraurelia]|uniref:Uncharacterized protein n=1 Tax=Paramecium tetraurelia TaxID=5888 RepID=A0E3Y5_PARTE|nr:uncharacterized protein GSPATT00023175001 [Paramecium tetraurelia]CAK90002.1 unnamed protein product [Paramecium tetraurelia]|eukprot:XP_001457399.1 hypothetical protein (macronuclear) [Paramecium tetraurelia strain d4-2]